MSAVLSPVDAVPLPDAASSEGGAAARKALDWRAHPGGFHDRVVIHRRPSPQDVETLLEQAAASQQVVASHARAPAARLLSHLSAQPWAIKGASDSAGLGAPYALTLKVGGRLAVLEVRCLPKPHLWRVRY